MVSFPRGTSKSSEAVRHMDFSVSPQHFATWRPYLLVARTLPLWEWTLAILPNAV